jgi:hypothetical protein
MGRTSAKDETVRTLSVVTRTGTKPQISPIVTDGLMEHDPPKE